MNESFLGKIVRFVNRKWGFLGKMASKVRPQKFRPAWAGTQQKGIKIDHIFQVCVCVPTEELVGEMFIMIFSF